jgi:dihydrodipicolinate synthase/N-acetylneuraminate lyase
MGAFDAGATGTVCGMANIFPEIMAKMYKQYLDGNREAAMETQRLILKIRKTTKMGATVPIMHYILKVRGVDAGYSLSPQIEIDETTKKKVKKELEELGLL